MRTNHSILPFGSFSMHSFIDVDGERVKFCLQDTHYSDADVDYPVINGIGVKGSVWFETRLDNLEALKVGYIALHRADSIFDNATPSQVRKTVAAGKGIISELLSQDTFLPSLRREWKEMRRNSITKEIEDLRGKIRDLETQLEEVERTPENG